MNTWIFVALVVLASCSQTSVTQKQNSGAQGYILRDTSGDYSLVREEKVTGSRIVGRNQIFVPATSKVLEKTLTISDLGTVRFKGKRVVAIRPSLSQYTVWLENKRYFSQIKLLAKSRQFEVITQGPEAKWNDKKFIRVPLGRVFCFYNQMPECLRRSGLLEKLMMRGSSPENFVMVWDNYPFHLEQYDGLSGRLAVNARIQFEGEQNGGYRYSVEADGQMFVYHFSKNMEFSRMFWVAQGLMIIPPSEYSSDGLD